MKEIDARGLSCPAPVLQARAALEEGGIAAVKILLDNAASQQNVQRFLESRGFSTRLSRQESDFVVTGHDPAAAPVSGVSGQGGSQPAPGPEAAVATLPVPSAAADLKQIMILCATDRIGSGDDVLGMKLMVNFIRTLKEIGPELWRLVFVNNGVKLATAGSPVLPELQDYEKKGLKILVCGTCLEHFDLMAAKRAGETTNMLDIVTAMQLADKVITLG